MENSEDNPGNNSQNHLQSAWSSLLEPTKNTGTNSPERWSNLLKETPQESNGNIKKTLKNKNAPVGVVHSSVQSADKPQKPTANEIIAQKEDLIDNGLIASEENQEEAATVFTVTALNQQIKKNIENEFPLVWLQGEISNFKPHTSGHFYFSLKDEKSQINAVMFKGFNSRLKFRPESGMEVIVRGKVTVYEPRGTYQIFCESMEPVGAGALQKAFEQLKEKLQREGLFDPKHKKTWAAFPQQIAIVTSPTGAAIQDMLQVLGRRYRSAQITLLPVRVQGDGAAPEVAKAIEQANQIGGFDVMIVGRGGGSIEDLWPFNEEIVARAIFASKIPIISAVGHEIDFTIADFVADYRAPTPSAAAEVVAKNVAEVQERLRKDEKLLRQLMLQQFLRFRQIVEKWQSRLVDPKRRLEDLSLRCDELSHRMTLAWQRWAKEQRLQVQVLRGKMPSPQQKIQWLQERILQVGQQMVRSQKNQLLQKREHLEKQMALLDSFSPLRVLQRGYAVVYKQKTIVKEAGQVQDKDQLKIQLGKGDLLVEVKKRSES